MRRRMAHFKGGSYVFVITLVALLWGDLGFCKGNGAVHRRFVRARIYTARIADVSGLTFDDRESLAREKGSIEEVVFSEEGFPTDAERRVLVRSGEGNYGYPGFSVRHRKLLEREKAAKRLREKADGSGAESTWEQGGCTVRVIWQYPSLKGGPLYVRCEMDGKEVGRSYIFAMGKGRRSDWPRVVETRKASGASAIVQVFEYLDEDGLPVDLQLSGLLRAQDIEQNRMDMLGEAKSSPIVFPVEAEGLSVISDDVTMQGNWTGIGGYSYDSKWQPGGTEEAGGFPVQIRLYFAGGADIQSRITGTFLLDASDGRLYAGAGSGELAMNFGFEFSLQGALDLYFWEPIVFDLPFVPNFDYGINNSERFSSYLLDSSVRVSDATSAVNVLSVDLIEIVLAGGLPIPGIGGGIGVDVALSGRCDMTAEGIAVSDGSVFVSEGQGIPISVSSSGYHEVASYEENLQVTAGVIIYPTLYVEFAIWTWPLPVMSLPWDVISGRVDLDFSSSGLDFGVNVPLAPYPQQPMYGAVIEGDGVEFQWTSSDGASEYYLQVGVDESFVDLVYDSSVGNTTIVELTGFPNNGTRYYWRVKAGNAVGWSHFSDIHYFYNGTQLALPEPPRLSVPGNGSYASGVAIEFSWSVSDKAQTYYIELSLDGAFTQIVGAGEVGNTTTINVEGFGNVGTEYHWRVKAGNSSGWGNFSSSWSFRNGVELAPEAPALVYPTFGSMVGGQTIEFRWSASARADNYGLQIARDELFSTVIVDEAVGDTTIVQVDGFADDGAAFYWRVKAGNSVGWSQYSESWGFANGEIVVPSCPSHELPPNESIQEGDTIEFQWEQVDGATNYYLEIALDAAFTEVVYGGSLGDYVSVVGSGFPNDGTRFYWRVFASNSAGQSDCQQYWYVDNGHTVSLRINSPNGGELLERGKDQEIAWTTLIMGAVRIELLRSGLLHSVVAEHVENTGSFIWEVPGDQPEGYDYAVRIVSLEDASATDESDAHFSILSERAEFLDGFEGGDFTGIPWQSGGDGPWTIALNEVGAGVYAARSGAVPDYGQSAIRLESAVPTGTISFLRKVSSEERYDWLMFLIDDELIGVWSGERDWAKKRYNVVGGPHTFAWLYGKDGSESQGSDCGWIDSIMFKEEGLDPALHCWADFSGYTIRTHNMEVAPERHFAYNWFYEDSWLVYAADGGFVATFDLSENTSLELSITHLSSAASSCSGGGYSPVTVKVNGETLVENYDPAEHNGGSHGLATDTWHIEGTVGENVFELISDQLCTNYWIQSLEVRYVRAFDSDVNNDNEIDFGDLALFGGNWGEECAPPNWCGGQDVDRSRLVGFGDIAIMAMEWLR